MGRLSNLDLQGLKVLTLSVMSQLRIANIKNICINWWHCTSRKLFRFRTPFFFIGGYKVQQYSSTQFVQRLYRSTFFCPQFNHGPINYIDTKAKCRHLIRLTCKGTLRQVLIRVNRLEIQSVILTFSTQLCELLPF